MIKKIYDFFVLKIIGRIAFDGFFYFLKGKSYSLTKEDQSKIYGLLKSDNFVILIWRKSHLTSYLISLGHFLLTGRFANYSHACINIEGNVDDISQVDIVEAIGRGVVRSEFFDVFNCDAVCLLKPKLFRDIDWQKSIAELNRHVDAQTQYDTTFNIENDKKVSCIELVVDSLRESQEFNKFNHLNWMMKNYKNITPQMLRDCNDFEIVFEIRR